MTPSESLDKIYLRLPLLNCKGKCQGACGPIPLSALEWDRIVAHIGREPLAAALETAGGQIIYGMAYGRPAGAELVVSVRTVHLQITVQRPPGARTVWPVRVEKIVFQGDFSQVHLKWGDQRLIARCAAMEPIAAGSEFFMTVEPRRVVLLGAGKS